MSTKSGHWFEVPINEKLLLVTMLSITYILSSKLYNNSSSMIHKKPIFTIMILIYLQLKISISIIHALFAMISLSQQLKNQIQLFPLVITTLWWPFSIFVLVYPAHKHLFLRGWGVCDVSRVSNLNILPAKADLRLLWGF